MLPDDTRTRPRVGDDANSLGIRVPQDIAVVDGYVQPGRTGMSVSPSVDQLPIHRIPKRFVDRQDRFVPTGNNKLICWTMGDGQFVDSAINNRLMLLLEPENNICHGVVSPAQKMSILEFRNALAETQSSWTIVPWPWEISA